MARFKPTRNVATNNPKFWLLEAAPERYLEKSSTTVLVLIKALEAFGAVILSFNILSFLQQASEHGFSSGTMTLFKFLEAIIPKDFMQAVTFGTSDTLQKYLTGKGPEPALTTIMALCILFLLVCVVIEGAACITLRFRFVGSGVARKTHKMIFFATLAMLFIVCGLTVLLVYNYITGGLTLDSLLNDLRAMIITVVVIIVLIGFRIRYHKAVVSILEAIDFELVEGYKETTMTPVNMSKYFFIFGAVCIAAAVLYILKAGFMNFVVLVLAVEVIKYITCGNCWNNFHHCHM